VAKTKRAHRLKDVYWQAVGNAPYMGGYGYTLCSDVHSLRPCMPYITVPTTSFEYEVWRLLCEQNMELLSRYVRLSSALNIFLAVLFSFFGYHRVHRVDWFLGSL